MVSTGKSSLEAVKALREAGGTVLGMVAIFSYLLDEAKENFKKAKCHLVTLSDYNELIKKAIEDNYIHSNQIEALKEWRQNPKNWYK